MKKLFTIFLIFLIPFSVVFGATTSTKDLTDYSLKPLPAENFFETETSEKDLGGDLEMGLMSETVEPCYVTYSTATSTTWTVPTGVERVDVLLIGGGGSGGAWNNTSGVYPGGGGGGSFQYYTNITVTGSISIIVGAGGSGVSANSDGGAGGYSQFYSSDYRANGGSGGVGSTGVGGAGGSGGGASHNLGGSNGSNGLGANGGLGSGISTRSSITETNVLYSGGGGGGTWTASANGGSGGGGAGSGAGWNGGCASLTCNGTNGLGGGGGGRATYSNNGVSGAGGSGAVIISWCNCCYTGGAGGTAELPETLDVDDLTENLEKLIKLLTLSLGLILFITSIKIFRK